jgi:glycosyltransferase involved in cell wall biosynthesis
MTAVSVIVPSYNHGRYVIDAVKSVLRQSVAPTEVIVVDDASQDDSVERLRSLSDPRVRLISQSQNQGGSETLNVGIRASTCDFIAICNSDDLWEPHKLERQLAAFEENPELSAVFSDVSWIGEFGQAHRGHGAAFQPGNRTRYGWVRHLVEKGNCLCHPSVLIRRGAYETVGEYDNRLRQLPDYKMWLSIVCHFDIHVLDEKLIRFRVHDNTSAPSPAASTRDRNECALIIEGLMNNISAEVFCLAFGSRLHSSDPRFDFEVEKVIYLWSIGGHLMPMFRDIACRAAMRLLGTELGAKAWSRYGFSMRDFHVLHGITSPWHTARPRSSFSADEVDVLTRILGRPAFPHHESLPHQVQLLSNVPPTKIQRELSRLKRQIKGLFSH